MLMITSMQKIWSKTKEWHEVARQRRELKALSDEMLKDIGISRSDADFEASRHFWDISTSSDTTLRKSQITEVASVKNAQCQACCP